MKKEVKLDDLSDKALAAMMNALNPGIDKWECEADKHAFGVLSAAVADRWELARRVGEVNSLIEDLNVCALNMRTIDQQLAQLAEKLRKIAPPKPGQ